MFCPFFNELRMITYGYWMSPMLVDIFISPYTPRYREYEWYGCYLLALFAEPFVKVNSEKPFCNLLLSTRSWEYPNYPARSGFLCLYCITTSSPMV